MKLTEEQLKQIIQESAVRVLSEINKEYDDMKKAQAYDKYLGQNMLKRGWDIVTGKRPEKPNPYTQNEPMKDRAQRYVDAFNKEKGLGNRIDYPYGESYHSAMTWSDDPENRYEPVLKQTSYDGSTVAQQRKAYDEEGNEKEWGVEYPYSEFGYTGEYQGDNDDIKKHQEEFKKLRGEVSGRLAQSKRDREKKNESVKLTPSEFSKFLEESIKSVINEIGYHEKQKQDVSDDEHEAWLQKKSASKKAYYASQKKDDNGGSKAIDYYKYKHGDHPAIKESVEGGIDPLDILLNSRVPFTNEDNANIEVLDDNGYSWKLRVTVSVPTEDNLDEWQFRFVCRGFSKNETDLECSIEGGAEIEYCSPGSQEWNIIPAGGRFRITIENCFDYEPLYS